jgi:hypothetical protein
MIQEAYLMKKRHHNKTHEENLALKGENLDFTFTDQPKLDPDGLPYPELPNLGNIYPWSYESHWSPGWSNKPFTAIYGYNGEPMNPAEKILKSISQNPEAAEANQKLQPMDSENAALGIGQQAAPPQSLKIVHVDTMGNSKTTLLQPAHQIKVIEAAADSLVRFMLLNELIFAVPAGRIVSIERVDHAEKIKS